MSSVPPNMPPNTPPGGGPYSPYDAKAPWRAYRAQQKAAWREQRSAWRAQRAASKAQYVNAYGPRVPSMVGPILLIGVGLVSLLVVTGHLASGDFWSWYSHWWPLLLIGAGLALLAEWAIDLRRATPVRRSSGFIGILVLLAIVGLAASGWQHVWGPINFQFGDKDDFSNYLGMPEHDFDQQIQPAQIPAGSTINIQNPRGDVSITAGDGQTVEVQAHEVAYTSSDSDAQKIFAAEAAHLTVSGSAVLIKSDGHQNGRLNLTVSVPKNARVVLDSGKGDVTVAGVGTGLTINSVHGDTHLDQIAGPVQIHFGDNRHDFSAHQIDGDLTSDGNTNDVTLSEVKGRVTVNGEIFGEAHLESIGGPINLHTSITDLQLAGLPGDLTLNSDDLRVTQAKGQAHIVTHSKDVELNQMAGDSYVQDRDGRIAIESIGNFSVEAHNNKGDVEVTLPPTASAKVQVSSRNGDVVSDFAAPNFGAATTKAATFTIGGGAARIVLSADNGDVRLKRGSNSAVTIPTAPKAPATPSAPHLKAPRLQQEKQLTQQ
ncbi:DUF4097 family beta strand repeat-containing protein [Telmatobacter bradus]|uniref:DUF4097 family beta strand repeat-containing protein n=1 Tax=Telmatobacter bradus TaxID=474953 RepID=UPI003B42E2A1